MATPSSRRAAQLAALAGFLAWPLGAAGAPSRADMEVAVRDLGGDHDRATAARYELQSGGREAATAIRDGWSSMSPLAKQRAIAALRTLAADHDAAIDALVEAARSGDDALRESALQALAASAPRGRRGMVKLLGDPNAGERAASLVARSDPDFAIEPLLGAMTEPGGSSRRDLRDGLAVAVQRAKSPRVPLRAWLAASPPAEAVASAALGLSAARRTPSVLISYVEYALEQSGDFETTWRLLQSATAAGPSASVDRWVARQLHDAEPWMLRAAAVDAVTARGRRDDARGLLADPYPRVRARAATALSGDASTLLSRAKLARKDVWPMVRAAAVRSLRSEPDALPVIVAAVDDSMSVVRAAAIEVLTASSHDEGWDRIHRRLRAPDEWPKVTAAAIRYASAHCRADAAGSLFRVVMRAAPSNALTEDLNNAAEAIEALQELGTSESEAVLERLRATPGVPPTLKMALERPKSATGCVSADP